MPELLPVVCVCLAFVAIGGVLLAFLLVDMVAGGGAKK